MTKKTKVMFWDFVSGFYDVFENMYNGSVNRRLCRSVAARISPSDEVLECACGTGMISVHIARACRSLTATDYSDGMLRRVRKRCREMGNVSIERCDIMHLGYSDESFDKVVAANVIHLLDGPELALAELMRVCRKGGEVIVPTYLCRQRRGLFRFFIRFVNMFGTTFHLSFDEPSYRAFFARLGYSDVSFELIDGRMPCCIAVIRKRYHYSSPVRSKL